MSPSVSILEAHGGPISGLHMEARSGDPSTVAVASTLASLSHLSNNLSLHPPSRSGQDAQQGSEIPSVPSASDISDNRVIDAEMNDVTAHNDVPAASVSGKTGTPPLDITNENSNMNAKVGKIVEENSLRPVLHFLTGPTIPMFDMSGSFPRHLDESRVPKDQQKSLSKHQNFKDGLRRGLINCEDIDVSFENFPYYLR